MNPLVVSALSSILIWILTLGAGILVEHGIWTQADAKTYVTAAAMGILSLAWSQRNVILNRVKLLVALMPGMHTEDMVNAHIALKLPTPALLTPSNTSPGVPADPIVIAPQVKP